MMDSQVFRNICLRGVVSGLPVELPDVAPDVLQRWQDHFEKVASFEGNLKSLSPSGRRLNNFCIGSDPEFVFVDPRGRKQPAADLGLLPGLACGCDQNQRLAELRGWPTTSAVCHVAGILSCFRWLHRTYPITRAYFWRSGAHFEGDGLGGHIHFGRKRPNRELEVAGLDGLAHVMKEGSFFDTEGWERRLRGEGDIRQQIYGKFGDIRPQLHGYEYRTLPSWLCSPLKAFVVLAASKLVVLDPDLTIPWKDRTIGSQQEGVSLIRRLAAYHAGRDDDAYLLRKVMNDPRTWEVMRGWGTPVPDFKENWGLPHLNELTTGMATVKNILPAVIEPAKVEEDEITKHLLDHTPIQYAQVPPTFRNEIPKGYRWVYWGNRITEISRAGVGDLYHNLVVAEGDEKFSVCVGRNSQIARNLWEGFTSKEQMFLREAFPGIRPSGDCRDAIIIETALLGVKSITRVREALLHSGLFPVWTVNSVKEDSLSIFLQNRRKSIQKVLKPPTPRERIL